MAEQGVASTEERRMEMKDMIKVTCTVCNKDYSKRLSIKEAWAVKEAKKNAVCHSCYKVGA